MKILANMRKAFGMALAFALALSLSAPAQGQSVLNQIGKRAKNAVNTRATMGLTGLSRRHWTKRRTLLRRE